MSPRQKKAIDDHCTSEWAAKVAAPWADFEHAGIAKIKAEPGHEVYDISPAQLAEWRKAAAPLEAKWAEGAKKAGVDPELAMKGLQGGAGEEQSGLLMDGAARGRGPVDRFIDVIEVTAAGFLAVVTLLTFVSVFLRYLFAWSIPDATTSRACCSAS